MSGDLLLRAYVYILTAGLLAWAVFVIAYVVGAGVRLGWRWQQRLRPQGEPTT